VVDGVLGEASVARETFRAMPFFEIAVIQARGIPAFNAVLTALASFVYFDGDAVADLKLIDAWSQRCDGAGVLVAHDELSGGLSLECAMQDFDVRSAD
jgi:hypothetical protein